MTTELKSLAFTEDYPKGQRVSIMREMMIWGNCRPVEGALKRFIYAWNGSQFIFHTNDTVDEHPAVVPHAAEVPVKKERPMTREEMLGFVAHNPHIVVRCELRKWQQVGRHEFCNDMVDYEWATITADGVIGEPMPFTKVEE